VIPQVPTFAEQGLRGYDAYSWNCLFAPATTADAEVARLNQALNAALALPAMKERAGAAAGSENLGPSTPAAGRRLRPQRARPLGALRAQPEARRRVIHRIGPCPPGAAGGTPDVVIDTNRVLDLWLFDDPRRWTR
jgi:hypothetical protein